MFYNLNTTKLVSKKLPCCQQVIWFKNDKPIKESQDIQLLFEGDRCTLIIREAIPNDDGHFKCVAQNPQGVAETTCKLHIERESFIHCLYPVFFQTKLMCV